MTHITFYQRIRKWLGAGPEHNDGESEDAEAARLDQFNRERLSAVCTFLIDHSLPVDGATLSLAYDAVTGSDPHLAGLVRRRLSASEPLTAEWIDTVRGQRSRDDAKAMTKLRERLEKSVADFTRTTHDARSATSDYRSALSSHVDELGAVSQASAVIIELANVSRAMLDRTQDIENQMARSERETRALQKRLDEAKRSAEIDHLTGLPNRRAFDALLESEYAEARRTRDGLCVGFCDIDKFKLINDLHGHDAGDRVLKLVARSLADISDDRCHVARHGGEEFVVLFRGKSLHEAHEILDGAREALSNRRLVNRATDTPFGQVSFSGGLVDVFAFRDPRAALKAADEALYAAKDLGRNRIVTASAKAESRAA